MHTDPTITFTFSARIYKAGINPCVDVPLRITARMKASKGYIPVKGKIEEHPFSQTLVPVKEAPYRLYVNGPMLKGANVSVGATARFTIAQDFTPPHKAFPMPEVFRKKLTDANLYETFRKLTPSRQKDVLKYLNYLKTEEARLRNIDNVLAELKKVAADSSVKFPRTWPFNP